jgi:hypothetical protein
MMRRARNDAHEVLRAKLEEMDALTWGELDRYGTRIESLTSSSGRRFRVKSYTFWDMEPWSSDLYVIAKAYATRGWRRIWPYKRTGGRRGEDIAPPQDWN